MGTHIQTPGAHDRAFYALGIGLGSWGVTREVAPHASELRRVGNVLLGLLLDTMSEHGLIQKFDSPLHSRPGHGLETIRSMDHVSKETVVGENEQALFLAEQWRKLRAKDLLFGKASISQEPERDVLRDRRAPGVPPWPDAAAREKRRQNSSLHCEC